MKADKGKQGAWLYDLRVRERFLISGALDPKTVERHLAELPDLEGHAETLPFEQPAVGGRGGHSVDDENEP
jgi:hypothetical protein